MLNFLTEHTLIIYVQYIKGSKRKTSYLLEILFEKDLVHVVSDSILKRLNFDYSSSETAYFYVCIIYKIKLYSIHVLSLKGGSGMYVIVCVN